MSKKAEEAARKKYPIYWAKAVMPGGYTIDLDANETTRNVFKLGYETAEKDLVLTWEDMKAITDIADKMMEEIVPHHSPEWLETEEKYYTEVLKRFKEAKR